jgi:hypothetical protein
MRPLHYIFIVLGLVGVLMAADLPQNIDGASRNQIQSYVDTAVAGATPDLTGLNDGGGTGVLTNLAVVHATKLIGDGTDITGISASGGGEAIIDGSRWFGWMPGYGSTVSNAAAPIYWSATGANGDDPAFGFTSSDTATLQSRYAFAVMPVAQSATGWKTGGNMTIVFRQSSDSAVTNTMAMRLSLPGGATWTTNLVSGAASTITTWTVPVAALPTFVAPTGTSNVTVRCDYQQFAGASNAILAVKLPWQ